MPSDARTAASGAAPAHPRSPGSQSSTCRSAGRRARRAARWIRAARRRRARARRAGRALPARDDRRSDLDAGAARRRAGVAAGNTAPWPPRRRRPAGGRRGRCDGSRRWAAPMQDQLAGAQRPGDSSGDRAGRRAAAGAARSVRCRGVRRSAPGARSRRRSPAPRTPAPAPAAGVDDDQRPAPPREVLDAADGDVPPQAAGGEGIRTTACESQPQSSTSPPDQSRNVRACPRSHRRHAPAPATTPGDRLDRVGHQATCSGGVWMMLGQR